jgi:hypothetical protein
MPDGFLLRARVGRWAWPIVPALFVALFVVLPACWSPGRAQAHDPALARAVAHLESELKAGKGDGLAVHITSSGHWQFANVRGEIMTAAGAEEVRRAIATLRSVAPAAGAPSGPPVGAVAPVPALILTDEAAGRGAANLDQLPAHAALAVLVDRTAYRLARVPVSDKSGSGKPDRLLADVRPHLLLEVTDPQSLRETLWQLDRKLDPAAVRLLSLEPGGPRTLPATPKRDAAGRSLLPDGVDPFGLVKALPALRGQKVLIVGRLDKDVLWFQPRTGGEQSVLLQDLRDAAMASDIALVVLDARLPRQPGERTWSYLKVNVPGLDEAMKGTTVGDFYNAVASAQGKLVLRVREQTPERFRIEATPLKTTWGGFGATAPAVRGGEERSVGGVLQDLVSGLTGSVATSGVHMDLRSRARQIELDRRWLPGLPSTLQMGYALLLALGLAAWPTAARWWGRLWPAEDRGEYGAGSGYWAARLIRAFVFVCLFVPAVAAAAFPLQVVRGLAENLLMFRRRLRLGRKRAPQAAGAANPPTGGSP